MPALCTQYVLCPGTCESQERCTPVAPANIQIPRQSSTLIRKRVKNPAVKGLKQVKRKICNVVMIKGPLTMPMPAPAQMTESCFRWRSGLRATCGRLPHSLQADCRATLKYGLYRAECAASLEGRQRYVWINGVAECKVVDHLRLVLMGKFED